MLHLARMVKISGPCQNLQQNFPNYKNVIRNVYGTLVPKRGAKQNKKIVGPVSGWDE